MSCQQPLLLRTLKEILDQIEIQYMWIITKEVTGIASTTESSLEESKMN